MPSSVSTLAYVDKDGTEKTPVVLHRAILGSLDRFMAYLIEETKGRFPTWLAPVQVKVLPITDRAAERCVQVQKYLEARGVRVETDLRNEKIGFKIREAQMQKIPYMLVLGDKEVEQNLVAVRSRRAGDLGTSSLEDFSAKLLEEIASRAKE